jgi:DGQHR domain-containing protein
MKATKSLLKFPALTFKQGEHTLVLFHAEVGAIWSHFSINRRVEDKDEGYQRTLSEPRIKRIAKYIQSGNPLPLGILVTIEKDKCKLTADHIEIVDEPDVGWIIDGQHRVAGAHESKTPISLPIVAFVGLDIEQQIRQFVTVNKEAKGVPTSLYFDLLAHLPIINTADQAKQRSVDIAHALRIDEQSPFYARIVAITSPKKGELSLNTFASKIAPLILAEKGILSTYKFEEQVKILDNYFKALKNVFPKHYKDADTVFFKTTGFGALLRVFPSVFSFVLKAKKGFAVADATFVLNKISHFEFNDWKKIGTGNAAEIQAADELRTELEEVFADSGDALKIRL